MSLRAVHLRCEQREDVPCVDDPAPRLGWALESAGSDKRQTAYRIRVGEWWDSGRVESANSVDIAYAGRPLPAAAECVWTVQVWDEAGAVSEWSEPARFRTGLAGWSAQWIGRDRIHDPGMAAPSSDDDPDRLLLTLLGCPYLRRSFELAGGLRRATLYATARGVAELELNGTRVGDAVLAPGWTDYRKRIEYAAHDVTDARARGRERARRDPRAGVVRRLHRLRPAAARQPLRPRPGAAVRAPPRARRTAASRSSPATRSGRPRPARSSTRTC